MNPVHDTGQEAAELPETEACALGPFAVLPATGINGNGFIAFTTLGPASFKADTCEGEANRLALAAALAPRSLTWLHLEHKAGVAVVQPLAPACFAQSVQPVRPLRSPASAVQLTGSTYPAFPLNPLASITPSQHPHAHAAQPLRTQASVTQPLRPQADAALVLAPGAAAALTTADCVPVVVASPCARLIAVIHAGWRGLAAGVIAATLSALAHQAGGALPHDLKAWIGPAIGPQDYEVGAEVCEQLLASIPGTLMEGESVCRQVPEQCAPARAATSASKRYAPARAATSALPAPPSSPLPPLEKQCAPARKATSLVDLPGIARLQLAFAGIAPERIACCPLSTFTTPQLHSARRNGAASGRMATVVALDTRG